jgi:hypothetical protein
VIGAMRGGSMYGVRLGGLVVVDDDTSTDESRAYIRDRFGESTVQVKTSRGVHHYFEYAGGPLPPAKIRLDKIAIDIKSGANEYVAGPLSYRPDTGVIYDPIVGRLGVTEMPIFVDLFEDGRSAESEQTGTIKTGERNTFLFRQSLKIAQCHDDFSDFLADVITQRDWDLDDSESFSNSECEKIARSVWKYKQEGNLYAGSNSTYRVNSRKMKPLLKMGRDEHDAFLLYHLLSMEHGHIDRAFYIASTSMAKEKVLGDMCKGRIDDARNILLRYNLIKTADKKGRGFTYKLTDEREWTL